VSHSCTRKMLRLIRHVQRKMLQHKITRCCSTFFIASTILLSTMKGQVFYNYLYFLCMKSKLYGFENINFWDVTLCSPVRVHRRFVGTYCLHLQSQGVSQAKSALQVESFLICKIAFQASLEFRMRSVL
jgi:hypothetical protein